MSVYPEGEVAAVLLLSDERVVAVLKRCSDLIRGECGVTERIPKSERHLWSAFAVEGGDIQEEIAALLVEEEGRETRFLGGGRLPAGQGICLPGVVEEREAQ